MDPRVRTSEVVALIRPHVQAYGNERGIDVALLAELAESSPRTVYRVLSCEHEFVSLDLADRLLLAVGESVTYCEVVHG